MMNNSPLPKAIHDRVILRILEPQTETAAGIMLPAVQERPSLISAVVITTGPGKMLDDGHILPPLVEADDTVLIYENSGSEFQNPDGVFRAIRDEEIIAILEK